MYDTGGLLPVDGFPERSVVRVSGPAMVGKHELIVRLLAAGIERGEACVVVTTDRTAAAVTEELQAAVDRDLGGAPLGFVVASGTPDEGEPVDHPVETVGSPTDLTGIGIALSNQLEALSAPGRPIRIGFLSLSTLLLYNDPERVLKFMHVLSQRVSTVGGLALLDVNEGAIEGTVAAQMDPFVDGEVVLREAASGPEIRVRGFDGVDTGWGPFTPVERGRAGGRQAAGPPPADPSIDEIADLVRTVDEERSTLTVANYTGDEELLSDLAGYFERLNVEVRTTDLGTDTPQDVAMLHREADFLAGASVADLAGAVAIGDDADIAPGSATTELLDAVDRTVFDTSGLDRRLLVQASHTIEGLALRIGEGRLHAGFQRLSRLVEDDRTRRIYDRLADSDVEVHLYGVPDVTVENEGLTVHDRTDEEIERTWFLSYVGPDSRAGSLVAIEHPDSYHGFWSYRPDLATELDAYLCSRY